MKKINQRSIGRLSVLCGLLLAATSSFVAVCTNGDGWMAALVRATRVIVPRPQIFGAFHLSMLALCLVLMVAVAVFYPKFPRERLDDVLFYAGVFLFVMEWYKQLYYPGVLTGGQYNFGILPLQLCSYALYLYLLIPFLKDGRFKEALLDFVGLYLTMGGCIVMGYPTLYEHLALSLHTMLWHTVMIGVGMLTLLVRFDRQPYLRQMRSAGGVFVCTVCVAMVLNFVLTPYTDGSYQPLNLFYISPYIQSHYIIIGDVQRLFGWAWSVLAYVGMFVGLGANVVWIVGRGIKGFGKDC
jgi:hypothetical protein